MTENNYSTGEIGYEWQNEGPGSYRMDGKLGIYGFGNSKKRNYEEHNQGYI